MKINLFRSNVIGAGFGQLILLLMFAVPTSTRTMPETAMPIRVSPPSDANLQRQADALLPLFDNMPPVPIELRDEPITESKSNTERAVAYTNCDRPQSASIVVKQKFYLKANRVQLENILKHELTHSWLCRQNLMSGHDENFRRKFQAIGGFGN